MTLLLLIAPISSLRTLTCFVAALVACNNMHYSTRSGYEWQDYYSIADDGYVTQILHLINPLADQSQLRQPPVLLLHGAHIDISAYMSASSIQHHPEKYPRTEADGPMTSSNRSLAYVLANNGFDVWLVSTRSANRASQAYVNNPQQVRQEQGVNFRPNASHYTYHLTSEYWYFGLDEISEYELKYQIDLVLELTNSSEFIYLSYSLSTPTTLAFLAANPDYARRVRQYVQLAPAIAASQFEFFSEFFWQDYVPTQPTRGIGFFPSYILDQPLLKQFFIQGSRSVDLRYSLIYEITRLLFGPSPIYQTNLERNMLAHIFRPNSFKQVQHYGINSVSRQFTKFDYGPDKNIALYGQLRPPVYNVSRIEVQRYTIVSGSLDVLASPETVQKLIETVSSPTGIEHIIAPAFNHLDIIAAVEVARYVNFPLLRSFIANSD